MNRNRPIIGIVDDDISFREALAGLVASFGFDAVAFASARELLQSDRLPEFRCLIADVQMPGMDGLDLQEHIARSGPNIPIIFVSAHRDPQSRTRALEAGAVAFLDKPCDSEELLRHIHAALGSSCV
jgi:FixJ family two-component response regulator